MERYHLLQGRGLNGVALVAMGEKVKMERGQLQLVLAGSYTRP